MSVATHVRIIGTDIAGRTVDMVQPRGNVGISHVDGEELDAEIDIVESFTAFVNTPSGKTVQVDMSEDDFICLRGKLMLDD